MSMLTTIERKFLFTLTRVLALLVIAVLVIGIVIGVVMVERSRADGDSSAVAPHEVVDVIKPKAGEAPAAPDQETPAPAPKDLGLLPGVKLSFVLQKHFSSPENVVALNNWLRMIPEEQRQPFLDEMAATVTEAERQQLDPISAINTFHELKMQKLADKKISDEAQKAAEILAVEAAAGALGLIALFSLILVLLAIERNTRDRVQA